MTKKEKFPIIDKAGLFRAGVLVFILGILSVWSWLSMIRMPGKSYHGPLGPLNEEQLALRAALKGDIEKLAGEIGPRSLWQYNSFKAAAAFVGASLQQAGFEVRRQQYKVEGCDC